jgi:hypothetical protein
VLLVIWGVPSLGSRFPLAAAFRFRVLLLGIALGLPACSSEHLIAPTPESPGGSIPAVPPWQGTLSGAVLPVGSVIGAKRGDHAAYVGLPPA